MAKVHLQIGLFGQGACGKAHVDVSKDWHEVTCKGCQGTAVYEALKNGTITVDQLNLRGT